MIGKAIFEAGRLAGFSANVLLSRLACAGAFAGLVMFLAPSAAPGQTPAAVSGVEAGVKNGKVYISARLYGAFTEDTLKVLSGGAPVTFTYAIQVKGKRSLLWDRTARQTVMKRVVKYDTLKKTYMVWEKTDDAESEDKIGFEEELRRAEYSKAGEAGQEGKQGSTKDPADSSASKTETPPVTDPLILPTIAETMEWMSNTGLVDMGPVESLGGHGVYYAKARLKVKSISSSPRLTYILFFVSFLDFDTGWLLSESFTVGGSGETSTQGAAGVL